MPKIVAENLTKIYYGGYTAFSDVSFQLENELLLVFGGYKSGKTSLLKCIGGAESFTSGKLMIDNIDIAKIEPKERNIGLTYGIESLKKNKSVLYNLVYPLKIRKFNNEQIKNAIDKILTHIDISAILELQVHTLSFFELAMLILARLFILDRKAYLVDNGVFNLNVYEKEKLVNIIADFAKNIKKPIIFATEDKQDLHKFSTKILMLVEGKAHQSDSYNSVYNLPNTLTIAKEISSHINIIETQIFSEKEISLFLLNKKIIIKNKSLATFSKVKLAIYPENIKLTKINQEKYNKTRFEFDKQNDNNNCNKINSKLNLTEALDNNKNNKCNDNNNCNKINSKLNLTEAVDNNKNNKCNDNNNCNKINSKLDLTEALNNNKNALIDELHITEVNEDIYKVTNVYSYGFYNIFTIEKNEEVLKVASCENLIVGDKVSIVVNKILIFDYYSEYRISEQIVIN